ncbi:MAG: anti-sigma factor antagonist [Saprospiraceae bacterium]|nr:MAG: anti-sigma factor antagonist [Saprospiraceae bacterium]
MLKFFKLDFSNFKGDFFGGLTAGIVALPLALAFGGQTELGAISGLYGAIAIGVLATLFGGTDTQISGPTAPMTVVSMVVILDAIEYAGDLTTAFPIIIATFFLAGALEAILGVLGIGRYIRYIPYPVISGFMSGIGVIIIIGQIFPFFGATNPGGGSIGVVTHLGELLTQINWFSVILASATIGIIYLFPKLTQVIPGSLAALVIISLVAFFGFQGDVSVINDSTPGGVPLGLPKVHLNFFSVFTDINYLSVILEYAFTLAALGAIDSLLTSVVADNITKTRHNSSQELIGQGIGNMGAALIGGLPGAGATMRTVINIKSGGRTRVSGIIAGLFLLAILLGLGVFVGHIPNAVLAGILITVGIGIIDYKGFKHLRSMPKAEGSIMITVLLLTVFVGLLQAVAIGMVMASLLFMKKISDVIENRTYTAPLSSFVREIPWSDEGNIVEQIGEKVYIKHFDGPLFFGFSSRLQEMLRALPGIKVVVIRMDKVPYMDQSGMYALEEAVQELRGRGIVVVFTDLHGQPKDMLERINLIPGLVPPQHNFKDFKACTVWLYDYLEEHGDLNKIAKTTHPKSDGINLQD